MSARRQFLMWAAVASLAVCLPVRGEEVGYLHTVLFNLKPGLSTAERESVLDSIREQAELPGVKSLVLAPNIKAPNQYSQTYQWVAMVDYGTKADFDAFQGSAVHRGAVARSFEPYQTALIFCDLQQPFGKRIADGGGNKVRRILLFNFKPETDAAQRDRIVANLASLKDNPLIKRAIIGKNAYRIIPVSPLEWQLILEFATAEDAKNFANTPARVAFDRNVFSPAVKEVVVADIALD